MNRRGLFTLFGIGGLLLVCALILALNSRRIALYAAGFRGGQETDQVLTEVAQVPAPLQEGRSGGTKLNTVTVNVNGRDQILDTEALNLTRAEQTAGADGSAAYLFEYNEQDLNEMVNEVVIAAAPQEITQQVRNVQVDLKQNAAVVSAEANLGLFWQPLSIVVAVDSAGKTVDVTGIDINGQFFTTPPSGPLAEWIAAAEAQGTQALQTTTLAGPDGEPLTIAQISLTENGLQIIVR